MSEGKNLSLGGGRENIGRKQHISSGIVKERVNQKL